MNIYQRSDCNALEKSIYMMNLLESKACNSPYQSSVFELL